MSNFWVVKKVRTTKIVLLKTVEIANTLIPQPLLPIRYAGEGEKISNSPNAVVVIGSEFCWDIGGGFANGLLEVFA
jgi:hypothetical protein